MPIISNHASVERSGLFEEAFDAGRVPTDKPTYETMA